MPGPQAERRQDAGTTTTNGLGGIGGEGGDGVVQEGFEVTDEGRGSGEMGLFEENPLLLIPMMLATVIGYDVVKWAAHRYMDSRDNRQRLS